MPENDERSEFGGQYKDYQLTWRQFSLSILLSITVYIWFIIFYISVGQNKQIMHIEPNYPFIRTSDELRMRALSPVDPALFNPRVAPCDSLALYTSGAWAGSGERLPVHAARRAVRRLSAASANVAARDGEGRDFLSACVRSAIGVDHANNREFIVRALTAIDPPERANFTDMQRKAYALGRATGYGNEPVVRFRATFDPRPQGNSILDWDVGSTIRSLSFADPGMIETFVNSSCSALYIIDMRDVLQEDCVSDMLVHISWLLDLLDKYGQSSYPSYAYIMNEMSADVRTRRELAADLGAEFVDPFLDGVLSNFEPYREFLIGFDFDIPPLKMLSHWVRKLPFLREVVEKLAADSLSTTIRRIRVLLMIHNMDYTVALTSPTTRRASDEFLRSQQPLPTWLAAVPQMSAANGYIREEEMTHMEHSQITERCIWLMQQHLPTHVDVAYREATVPESRQALLRQVFVNVTLAALERIHRKALPRSERLHFSQRLQDLRFSVGLPARQRLPLGVAADASLAEFGLGARRAALVDNLFRGATRQRAVEPVGSASDARVYYDAATHTIVMTPGFAQQPFMSDSWSAAALYAMVGAPIGRQVVRALEFQTNATECVVAQYSRHATPRHGNAMDGRRVAEEARLDVGGLQLALHALETMNKGVVGTETLREFLEAYAQTGATGADARQERVAMAADRNVPALAREDGALRNLVDGQGRHVMTRMYNCPAESRMRPKNVCSVI